MSHLGIIMFISILKSFICFRFAVSILKSFIYFRFAVSIFKSFIYFRFAVSILCLGLGFYRSAVTVITYTFLRYQNVSI